jgi:hypothetical protein
MRSVSLLALAAAASAFDLNEVIVQAGNLHARQIPESTLPFEPIATISDLDCLSAVGTLGMSIPTPPPEIIGYMSEDFCFTDLPKNLSAKSSSFTSEWASWSSAHTDEIESAKKECPSITSQLDLAMNMCIETGSAGDDEGTAPRQRVMLLGAVLAAVGTMAALL